MNHNLHDGVDAISFAPTLSRTSTLTGAAKDLRDYMGKAKAILDAAAAIAGTDPTLNVKFQDSPDGTNDWQDMSGAAFAEVTDAASYQTIGIQIDPQRRYWRVIGTIGGTVSPEFNYSVTVIGKKDRI